MGTSNAILLPERFDYSFFQSFEQQILSLLGEQQATEEEIVLDFAQVQYLDSSALGMMVMANKQAEEKSMRIVLVNLQGLAAEIVAIARLDQMFIIR